MDRPALVVTGLCVLVAVALAAWSTMAWRSWSDASEREDTAFAELEQQLAHGLAVQDRLADQEDSLTDQEARISDLRSFLTPEALGAIVEVQTGAVESACEQARTAVRDQAEAPEATVVVEAEVAAAQSGDPVLHDLGTRWRSLLAPDRVQAELDTCAGDEAALIEAERQAAERQAAAEAAADPCQRIFAALAAENREPGWVEGQILTSQCGVEYLG